MTTWMEVQYASTDLFVIETREGKEAFAKTVSCKLCGQVLFDCERHAKESLDVFLHGMKAHYQIQHQITLGDSPSTDPKRAPVGP